MSDLPITDGGFVPVFDCRILVAPPDDAGVVRARCANLAGIEGHGPTERDALRATVTRFKATVAQLHEAREPIPFLDPPLPPADGEVERWLPVHL